MIKAIAEDVSHKSVIRKWTCLVLCILYLDIRLGHTAKSGSCLELWFYWAISWTFIQHFSIFWQQTSTINSCLSDRNHSSTHTYGVLNPRHSNTWTIPVIQCSLQIWQSLSSYSIPSVFSPCNFSESQAFSLSIHINSSEKLFIYSTLFLNGLLIHQPLVHTVTKLHCQSIYCIFFFQESRLSLTEYSQTGGSTRLQ